jgi:HlyD family secretion protein
MPGADDLFRKKALDKLSSPEQLDVMMQVTSPAGWVALAGAGMILLFVVIWSVVGTIGIRVDGQGILIRGAEVYDVTSAAQGRVKEVLVKPGERIRAGQVVARLEQTEMELRLANMKDRLKQMEAQKSDVGSTGKSLVTQYQAQLAELRQKVVTQEKLVARGLLTRTPLLRTKQELAQIEQAIASTRQMTSGEVIRVDDLKGQIQELEARLSASVDVKSSNNGRALEVVTTPGNLVSPGSRILTLEPLDAPLQTVIYIPAVDGKKVRPGMQVRVSPSTVKVEEYGFLVGTVQTVSEFPVTPEGLRRVLRNDRLAELWMGGSAPIEVVVSLTPDRTTPSGYKWSSSKGPPTQVYSGTIATASVVVEKRSPISYVLPVVKRSLGLS